MGRDEWIGLAILVGLVAVALYMRRTTATQQRTRTPQPTGEHEMPAWARDAEKKINWLLDNINAAKKLYNEYSGKVYSAAVWLKEALESIGKAISDLLSGVSMGAQLASTAAGAPSVASPGVQMVAV